MIYEKMEPNNSCFTKIDSINMQLVYQNLLFPGMTSNLQVFWCFFDIDPKIVFEKAFKFPK